MEGDEISITIEKEEENQSEEDFIKDVYKIAKEKMKRDNDSVYPSDFLYELIPIHNYYWMACSHPIALMLYENIKLYNQGYEEIGNFRGPLGNIVIHSDVAVRACRDRLVELCDTYKLKIIKTP
jgi:hypothetical protein